MAITSKYMRYEDLKRPKTTKEELKSRQERNINRLTTMQIFLHLVKRHEEFLLISAFSVECVYIIVKAL